MAYQWVAVTARTGEVIADLPDLTVGAIDVRLSDYSTATASLPVPTAPRGWVRATAPYAACLVLLDTTTSAEAPVPLWGGIVTRRTRTADDQVELSLSTWEAYLDRRYVTDLRYTLVDQCRLAAELVTTCVLDGSVPLVVEHTPGTTLRDRTYTHASDTTVASALAELSEVDGGPEFTITWRRTDTAGPVRWVPVLTIADRLGTRARTGLAPAVTLELPGSLTAVQLAEDWSNGSGATLVRATSGSGGQDEARPESAPTRVDDPDRPTTEHRWSPSSSISDVPTLDAHARGALAVLRHGAQTLSLTARAEAPPLLGTDWGLGDDLGYQIGGRGPGGADSVPAFPGGLAGVARCIGWSLDLDHPATVTPVLADIAGLVPPEES